MNVASIDTHVPWFVWTYVFISVRCRSRNGLSGSRGNSIFNILRNHQTVFHSDCTFSRFHQECTKVRFLLSCSFFKKLHWGTLGEGHAGSLYYLLQLHVNPQWSQNKFNFKKFGGTYWRCQSSWFWKSLHFNFLQSVWHTSHTHTQKPSLIFSRSVSNFPVILTNSLLGGRTV